MKFLVSAYTDHQHRKAQLLLCCQSLTLNHAVLVKLGLDLVGAVTWKGLYVASSNLLCMLLISSSWTSSIMAEKKSTWPIYCNFSHFTSIIWHCGRDNLKSFFYVLSSNLLCMLLITSSRTSSIMAGKKFKMADCHFSHFTSIIWPCGRNNDLKVQ